jgi:hypothetical protein
LQGIAHTTDDGQIKIHKSALLLLS